MRTLIPGILIGSALTTIIFTDAKVRCPGDQYARTLGQTLKFVIK